MKNDLFDELLKLPRDYQGSETVPGELQYLMGTRSFAQFCATLRGLLDPKGHCPFCIDAPTGAPYGWRLKENDFPLDRQVMRLMHLIIPNRHLTDPADMQPSDWVVVGRIFQDALKKHGVRGGGLVLRFGDPRLHAGTIPHLHFNILSPTGEEEYRVPLSKDEESRKQNYARLLAFRDELLKSDVRAKLFDAP